MGKRTVIFIHILFISLIFTLSYWFKSEITFEDAEPILTIVQNTSVMIFTIMGIWIAYVYPNAVLQIAQPSKVASIFPKEDLARVKLLVKVIIISAFVLALLIIGLSAKTFISKMTFHNDSPEVFSFIGMSSLLLLAYIQVCCVYAVIASSVNFIIDLQNMEAKKELSDKLD